jgi:hypothetical protein
VKDSSSPRNVSEDERKEDKLGNIPKGKEREEKRILK